MNPQTQTQAPSQQTKTTATAPPKTHPELQRLLEKEGGSIEYTPFGASDSIKLTVKMVQEFIAVKTKSGRTCSERDARRFIMLCQGQRLNPWAGDAFLVGYDKKVPGTREETEPVFSLIVSHVAFLKRAETSGDYEGMESGVIIVDEAGQTSEREGDFILQTFDDQGNISGGEIAVGGWARVYRKGRKPTYRRLSIRSMRPPYETPFWNELKAPGQIVKCAEADALRSTFPSLLGGLYMQEEQYDISRIVADSKRDNGKFEPTSRGSLVENVKTEDRPGEFIGAAGGRYVEGTVGPQPDAAQQQENAPEPDKAKSTTSAVGELQCFVLAGGFTFDHLKTWGEETKRVDNADSLAGFDDISDANAKRLLRIKSVLLEGLAEVKGRK